MTKYSNNLAFQYIIKAKDNESCSWYLAGRKLKDDLEEKVETAQMSVEEIYQNTAIFVH